MANKFNPTVARLRLRKCRMQIAQLGPCAAGKVARIDAVLDIQQWPFDEQRYREFCSEVGVPA